MYPKTIIHTIIAIALPDGVKLILHLLEVVYYNVKEQLPN